MTVVWAILALTPLMAILAVLALCAYIVRKEGSQGLPHLATILKVFAFHEVLKALVDLVRRLP
ncbi:MAG TPA: hypothetical protein VF635_16210 [Propionibacteriaceae bacterium]|jgi:Na+/H+-dicarboxylate symporter